MRQTTVRLSPATLRQIEALTLNGWGTQSDILKVSIDRMYREEISVRNSLTQDEQEQATQIARFVTEQGRVQSEDGKPQPESLAAEVSFEASERGFDEATAEAMGDYAARR